MHGAIKQIRYQLNSTRKCFAFNLKASLNFEARGLRFNIINDGGMFHFRINSVLFLYQKQKGQEKDRPFIEYKKQCRAIYLFTFFPISNHEKTLIKTKPFHKSVCSSSGQLPQKTKKKSGFGRGTFSSFVFVSFSLPISFPNTTCREEYLMVINRMTAEVTFAIFTLSSHCLP